MTMGRPACQVCSPGVISFAEPRRSFWQWATESAPPRPLTTTSRSQLPSRFFSRFSPFSAVQTTLPERPANRLNQLIHGPLAEVLRRTLQQHSFDGFFVVSHPGINEDRHVRIIPT